MQDIITIISNVGFPIVCCIFLYMHMNKQTELHHEEINILSEAINNNTAAVNQLSERLKKNEE